MHGGIAFFLLVIDAYLTMNFWIAFFLLFLGAYLTMSFLPLRM